MADGGRAPVPQRHDLDAEAAVLSRCMLEPDAALECVELLEARDFYADANQSIFQVILDIVGDGGTPDMVTVAQALRASQRLERVGGTPYLAQLVNDTPFAANLAEHAGIIRSLARVRRAETLFTLLAAEARTGELGAIDDWLDACERRVLATCGDRANKRVTAFTAAELASIAYQLVESAKSTGRPALGLLMGFPNVDRQLNGLLPGNLVVIGARPGVGKTSLLDQIEHNIAGDLSRPAIVLDFSLEVSAEARGLKALSRRSQTPVQALRCGRPGDWSKLGSASAAYGKLPILIDDDPYLTPMSLRARIRRHVQTMRRLFPNLPLGAVAVDYLQLMGIDGRSSGNKAQDVGEITRAMKLMAKEFGTTVIALSQLNRPKDGKPPSVPTLTDFRDSGRIEEDADKILGLHRDDAHPVAGRPKDGLATCAVLKNREGETGNHDWLWDGPSTSFREQSPEESADQAFDDFEQHWSNK